MKNLFLIIGTTLFLTGVVGCSNPNNDKTEQDGHALDTTNTMYNDGQGVYDTIGRDTLSADSLILPPTPMN